MSRHAIKQLMLLTRPPVYTVSFADSSILPHGKREDNARVKVAEVSRNGEHVRNDFDDVPIFQRPICNATWDSVRRRWCDIVWQGEPRFSWSPTEPKREVLYRCRPFYYRLDMGGDSAPVRVSVTEAPLAGFRLAPMFKNPHDFVYRPAFAMGCDQHNIPHSRAGLVPLRGGAATLTRRAIAFDKAARCERMADWFSDLLLQWVEFATRDLGSVMRGAAFFNKTYTVAYQKGEPLDQLSFSSAVTSSLCEGMSLQFQWLDKSATRDVIGFEAINENNVFVKLDRPLQLAEEDYEEDGRCLFTVTTQAWRAGKVLPHLKASSGELVASEGFYGPCAWRGKENPWGNTGSLLYDFTTCKNASQGAGAYFLADPLAWSGGDKLTEAWQIISDITFKTAIRGDLKSFIQSEERPFVLWPVTAATSDPINYYGAYAGLIGTSPAMGIYAGTYQTSALQNNPATLRSVAMNSSYQYGGARLVLFEGND